MATQSLVTARFSLKGARSKVDAQTASVPVRWGQGLDPAAGIYIEELRRRTPRGNGQKPGGLQSGWRVRVVSAGTMPRRSIYNTQSYLEAVLKGRPAIDQKAAGKYAPLHFWISGREFYRWRVGPAAANPFHLEAVQVARKRVKQAGLAVTIILRI